jgi:hypothetical protein
MRQTPNGSVAAERHAGRVPINSKGHAEAPAMTQAPKAFRPPPDINPTYPGKSYV